MAIHGHPWPMAASLSGTHPPSLQNHGLSGPCHGDPRPTAPLVLGAAEQALRLSENEVYGNTVYL